MPFCWQLLLTVRLEVRGSVERDSAGVWAQWAVFIFLVFFSFTLNVNSENKPAVLFFRLLSDKGRGEGGVLQGAGLQKDCSFLAWLS